MKIRTDKAAWMRDFSATPADWSEYVSMFFQKQIAVHEGVLYKVHNLKLKNDVLTYTLGDPVEPDELPSSPKH